MSKEQFERLVSTERQWAIGREAMEVFAAATFDGMESRLGAQRLTRPVEGDGEVADREALEAALMLRIYRDGAAAYASGALGPDELAPAWETYWRALGRIDALGTDLWVRGAMSLVAEPGYGLHAKLAGWSFIFASLAAACADQKPDASSDEYEGLAQFTSNAFRQLGPYAPSGALHFLIELAQALSRTEASTIKQQRCGQICRNVLTELTFEDEMWVMAAYDRARSDRGLECVML